MNEPCWRVAAASVCGSSHEKTGQPCQDALYWEVLPDGTLLAAVADGAGSAAHSDIGAAVATQATVKSLASALPANSPAPPESLGSADIPVRSAPLVLPGADTCVRAPAEGLASDREPSAAPTDVEEAACKGHLIAAVRAAREAVEAEAAARGLAARELACTLLVAIIRPGFVAAAQVGDGAVVAASVTGEMVVLTKPGHGEYLNETTFITAGEAPDPQLGFWRGDLAHWAMFTDGLQMLALKMPAATPHVPFFAPLFQFIAGEPDRLRSEVALTQFLRSSRIRERTDDDLTLLLGAGVR